jgi:predicted MPP superfamily phosphohydrolase
MIKQLLMAGAGAAAVAGAYTWLVEPHWVEFVRRRLPIRGLPRDLEGRTLVQLSDIHIGPRVDDDFLIRTFEQVEACRPDLVVITGDFVSYSTTAHLDQMRRVVEHVPQGRLGTFGVLGNHDYGRNWKELPVGDAVASIAERAGVTVLRNESRIVSGLQIVGTDDLWSPHFDVTRALADRDRDAATLVLCHNPDGVDVSGWDDYEGWILAGHTHGGQCKAPFLPPPLLPVKNRRYTAGEFALAGGRRLYINRGLGHLLKVRFNVRPEVTLFHLARA